MKASKRSRIQLIWVPLIIFLLFFSFASGQVLAEDKMVPRGARSRFFTWNLPT